MARHAAALLLVCGLCGAGAASAQNGYMQSEVMITLVEYQLIDNGFDPGTPDGVFDERLRTAILAFQAREGLPQDGIITDALLNRLDDLEGRRKREEAAIAKRVEAGPLWYYGIDPIEGVVVGAIKRGTIADEFLGLRPGDVITKVDGHPVGSAKDLLDRFGAVEPGGRVTVTIWRNGAPQEVSGTLGAFYQD